MSRPRCLLALLALLTLPACASRPHTGSAVWQHSPNASAVLNATASLVGDERRAAAELGDAPPAILPPEAPTEDRASPPPDSPARAKTLAGHLDRMLEKEFEKEAESCVPRRDAADLGLARVFGSLR